MFEQWVRYNQNICDELEDDEEEEHTMRLFATQYDDNRSEPPQKHGGKNKPGRRANKDRKHEKHADSLQED